MTRGRRNDNPCKAPDCQQRSWGRGLCQKHYSRQLRTGTTTMATPTEAQRFWAMVHKSNDCWVWQGGLSSNGYGTFSGSEHGTVAAHTYAYRDKQGFIPAGLELDHLCRNRACVNPAHLEPVTHQVNVLRGTAPPAVNAAKTHCKRGHEFTPENTVIKSGPRRECRTCKRVADLKRWHARKAANHV